MIEDIAFDGKRWRLMETFESFQGSQSDEYNPNQCLYINQNTVRVITGLMEL